MSATRRRRRTSTISTPPAEPSTGRLSYAEKVRLLLRESLLDAAADALTESSWTAVRMADIATAVGVSRQTVYNEFGSKDELARALLLREAGRFLAQVEAALDAYPEDPVGGLAAAVEVFLQTAATEPLLQAILGGGGPEHQDLSPLLTSQGMAVLPFITERLTERFLSSWPAAEPAQVSSYAEVAVRLAISHVVLPSAEPAVSAGQIAVVLAPYLRQLTG
ncbi:MAG: TetR family transcriptional regulator [Jatrophihabitans sp.]